jgi:hypothetical protein
MSRKKEPDVFDTEEDLEAPEEQEASALEDEQADEDPAPPKAKRGRSRKRSTPALPFAMKTKEEAAPPEVEEEETKVLNVEEEAVTVVEEEEKAPRKSRRKTKAAEKIEAPAPVPSITPAPSDGSFESLVKQFGAVNDNLERVVTVLHAGQGPTAPVPPPAPVAPKVIIEKTSLAKKITLAASFIAVILSFLSLSLSQSARQATVEAATPSKAAPALVYGPPAAISENRQRVVPKEKPQLKAEVRSPRRENFVLARRKRSRPKAKKFPRL